MWWMLLILTAEGWMAHSIYPTRTICEQQQMASETQCVMVEVRLPEPGSMSFLAQPEIHFVL
jgi:hypothetical protein